MKVKSLSRVQLFATPWTVAYQAFPPMGFSRQEYWSRLGWLPFPSPGDLPDPGTEPGSPSLQADSLPIEISGKPLGMVLRLIKVISVKCLVVSDSATPWTVALQVPLSMGFSRQEYWSGLPFPSPGYLPNLGTEPGSPA